MAKTIPVNNGKINGLKLNDDLDCEQSRLRRTSARIDEVGEFDAENESRVLVLYTGGTIGMKMVNGVYRPIPNFLEQNLRSSPLFHDGEYEINNNRCANGLNPPLVMPWSKEGKRIIYTVWEYQPVLDSCNMTMLDWSRLASDIHASYNYFEGFLILHGTDTMAYTASALSFMLENLGKPVVVTGSQIPIFEIRSDGRDNFLGALIMAGNFDIPEVCIYFNQKLMRGNRTCKVDSGALDAFKSPNLLPLAEMEIEIEVKWESIFKQVALEKFKIHTEMCPNVGILRLFPSITPETVKAFLSPPMKGVIVQSYGAGNGPDSREDLLQLFREAANNDVLIINITQCSRGQVTAAYAAGKALLDAGIIPGGDMTAEAALTKLAYILGKTEWDISTKKKMIGANLRGEMRVITEKGRAGKKNIITEFPLVERLRETMKISTADEIQLLKESLFPNLMCAAARTGDNGALEALKNAGAIFNQADYDGRTPLHIAASEGHHDCCKFLLLNGSSVHQRDRYGHTAYDDAIKFGHFDIIRLLNDTGALLSLPKYQLGTKLCLAAMLKDLKTIKSYALAGADLNQGDYDQRTCLHVAAGQGSVDIVEFLLSVGANPKLKDSFGLSALDEVEKAGHETIQNMMKKAGY